MERPEGGRAMSATVAPAPTAPGAPRRKKRGFRLHAVDWRTYARLLRAFGDRPRVRLTYDRGELELMVTSSEHEGDSAVLALLIAELARAFQLDLRSGGSVTMKRKRMKKGLEPDKCFWLANAAKMVGVKRLDLKIHPPPDLAVEVDVTRSSLDRFAIYATLGVPELWHLEGDALTFHVLTERAYATVPESASFPSVAASAVMPFVIRARTAVSELSVIDEFRKWLETKLAS
jgi:Uma2 family endonuclease